MKKEAATCLVVNLAVWLLAVFGFCASWWLGVVGILLALAFTALSFAAIYEVREIRRQERHGRNHWRRLS
jgi:CHASE2 domain-containing sensor protein